MENMKRTWKQRIAYILALLLSVTGIAGGTAFTLPELSHRGMSVVYADTAVTPSSVTASFSTSSIEIGTADSNGKEFVGTVTVGFNQSVTPSEVESTIKSALANSTIDPASATKLTIGTPEYTLQSSQSSGTSVIFDVKIKVTSTGATAGNTTIKYTPKCSDTVSGSEVKLTISVKEDDASDPDTGDNTDDVDATVQSVSSSFENGTIASDENDTTVTGTVTVTFDKAVTPSEVESKLNNSTVQVTEGAFAGTATIQTISAAAGNAEKEVVYTIPIKITRGTGAGISTITFTPKYGDAAYEKKTFTVEVEEEESPQDPSDDDTISVSKLVFGLITGIDDDANVTSYEKLGEEDLASPISSWEDLSDQVAPKTEESTAGKYNIYNDKYLFSQMEVETDTNTAYLYYTEIVAEVNANELKDGSGTNTTINGVSVTTGAVVDEDLPTIAVTVEESGLIDTITDAYLSAEESDALDNGASLILYVEAEKMEESAVPAADLTQINSIRSGRTACLYLDLSFIAQVTGFSGHKVTDTGDDKISVSVNPPSGLPSVASGRARHYDVIRVHDGTPKLMIGGNGTASTPVKFKTDKFSTYALTYNDMTVSTTTSGSSSSSSSYSRSSSSSGGGGGGGGSSIGKVRSSGTSKAYYSKIGKKSLRYNMSALGMSAKKASVPATVKINKKTYKVTSVASYAFVGYDKLTTLTIGKNVKRINSSAFSGCKSLKSLTINSKKLTAKKIKGALKGSSIKTIYVPADKVDAYKKIFTKSNVGVKVTVKAKK